MEISALQHTRGLSFPRGCGSTQIHKPPVLGAFSLKANKPSMRSSKLDRHSLTALMTSYYYSGRILSCGGFTRAPPAAMLPVHSPHDLT